MPFNCIVIIMITTIGIILEAISFQVSVKKRKKKSSLSGLKKVREWTKRKRERERVSPQVARTITQVKVAINITFYCNFLSLHGSALF